MDANCRKQLRLIEIAVLHGSGSRKAAEAVAWISETAHIALARPSSNAPLGQQGKPAKISDQSCGSAMSNSESTNKTSPSFKVFQVTNNPSPRRTVSWTTRMGRRMKPRFSPENIWFTVRQISQEAHLPVETVSEVLENDPAFVRAANLEAVNSEPVYASRVTYNREVSPIGKIKSVLVNRVVG